MDYFDILLAKKLEDDRDPKVEGLSVSENGRYHEDGVVYDPVIVNVPQTPLSKLTVTENGTYTAPSGTAYNEVEVDVPLPENAYLLKDIENTPTAIATFSDGANLPMPKLEVGIEPVQEGSGDPSPENIRPIIGWDEVNVTRTGKNLWGGEKLADDIVSKVPQATKDTTNKTVSYSAGYVSGKVLFDNFKPNTIYTIFMMTSSGANNVMVRYTDGTNTYINKDSITVTQADKSIECVIGIWSTGTTVLKYEECGIFEGVITAEDFVAYNGHTYTIDLNGTRYGGELDVVNGVLTVDRAILNMGDLTWTYYDDYFYTIVNGKAVGNYNILSSNYKVTSESSATAMHDGEIKGHASNTNLYVKDSRYTSASAFKTAMNGVQLVYELATPLTIQLPTTVVKSLGGVNNVWGDCGDILDLSYLAKEE